MTTSPAFARLDKLCHKFFSNPDVFNVLAEQVTCLTRYPAGHLSAAGAAGVQISVCSPEKRVLQMLDQTVDALLREASEKLPECVQAQKGEQRSVAIMFRDAALVLHASGHIACPDFFWYVSNQSALVAEGLLPEKSALEHFDGRNFPRMKSLTQPLKAQCPP